MGVHRTRGEPNEPELTTTHELFHGLFSGRVKLPNIARLVLAGACCRLECVRVCLCVAVG